MRDRTLIIKKINILENALTFLEIKYDDTLWEYLSPGECSDLELAMYLVRLEELFGHVNTQPIQNMDTRKKVAVRVNLLHDMLLTYQSLEESVTCNLTFKDIVYICLQEGIEIDMSAYTNRMSVARYARKAYALQDDNIEFIECLTKLVDYFDWSEHIINNLVGLSDRQILDQIIQTYDIAI